MENFRKRIKESLKGIHWIEFGIWFLVAVIFFVLDITLKYHYYYKYTENPKLMGESFIPGLINTTLVFNDGAAWNIGSGMKPLLSMISLIMAFVIFGIYLYFFKKLPRFARLSLMLCFSGDVGNLVDRLGFWMGVGIYKDHGVIDFIELAFMDFPIFNIADSCLVVGIFILAIGYLVTWIKSEIGIRKAKLENGDMTEEEALKNLVSKEEKQEDKENNPVNTEGNDNGTEM